MKALAIYFVKESRGINIIRFVNGKFVEEWERYDTLGMMQQLGLMPTSEKEK